MTGISRRTLLRDIFPGAVVTVVGVTAIAAAGVSLVPKAAEALPVTADGLNALKPTTDLIEKAQWRRGRRRRWVCWWHRGRRVCGWRWVSW
jgi:hypothetical protein